MADAVLGANPINLGKLLRLKKPIVKVRYHVEELGKLKLASFIDHAIKKR